MHHHGLTIGLGYVFEPQDWFVEKNEVTLENFFKMITGMTKISLKLNPTKDI